MSHGHINDRPFPRGALLGAAVLIAFTIGLTATVRWSGLTQQQRLDPAAAQATVALSFIDRAQGGVAILDAASGRQLTVLEPGTNGFIRGVMRGLARQRRMQGIGAEQPFILGRADDGQLWLNDPATGESIYLGAFGPTNEQAFAQLLPRHAGKS